MKKYYLLTALILASYTYTCAQGFKQELANLSTKKDTTSQLRVLNNWKKADANDPELYVAYFNYYVHKSMTEVISFQPQNNGEKSLVITDPKTNKPVAYLSGGVSYKKSLVDSGILYINKGIEKFPQRLDMRFGKIYILGKIEDYDTFSQQIIAAVDYAQKINQQWLWMDNKPVSDPQKFMLSSIQDYIGQLFNLGDKQLNNMRLIAQNILKYYPDNVENLSNLAITYLIVNDFDTALVRLLKAEKIAPTDAIVLSNIAYCYKNKNDKPNAIKYYELTEKYADADAKAYAQQELKKLRKN